MLKVLLLLLVTLICSAWSDQGVSGELAGHGYKDETCLLQTRTKPYYRGKGTTSVLVGQTAELAEVSQLSEDEEHELVDGVEVDEELFEEESDMLDPWAKLWAGEELLDTELEQIDAAMQNRIDTAMHDRVHLREQLDSNFQPQKLVLLSPFDAGSNLMRKSLEANFHGKIEFWSTWKHCMYSHGANIGDPTDLLQSVQDNNEKEDLQKLVLLAMVRSPISLLASWKKAPYTLGYPRGQKAPNTLESCAERDWRRQTKPCSGGNGCTPRDANGGFPNVWEWSGREKMRKWGEQTQTSQWLNYSSTVDVYNSYIRMYLALKDSHLFSKVVFIEYERLVLEPERIMQEIADAMDWPAVDHVHIVGSSAKSHGNAVGRDQAIKKMKERPWMREIDAATLKAICAELDHDSIRGFEEWPGQPYGEDCVKEQQ